jgi:hypothetical protein
MAPSAMRRCTSVLSIVEAGRWERTRGVLRGLEMIVSH